METAVEMGIYLLPFFQQFYVPVSLQARKTADCTLFNDVGCKIQSDRKVVGFFSLVAFKITSTNQLVNRNVQFRIVLPTGDREI